VLDLPSGAVIVCTLAVCAIATGALVSSAKTAPA
jgi:hypothetical protein